MQLQAITGKPPLEGTPTSAFKPHGYAIVQKSRLDYYWIGKSARFTCTCAGAGLGAVRGGQGAFDGDHHRKYEGRSWKIDPFHDACDLHRQPA